MRFKELVCYQLFVEKCPTPSNNISYYQIERAHIETKLIEVIDLNKHVLNFSCTKKRIHLRNVSQVFSDIWILWLILFMKYIFV